MPTAKKVKKQRVKDVPEEEEPQEETTSMDVVVNGEDVDEQPDEEGGIRIDDIYIPPPPPPACTFDATGPRLVITHIENENFKSYAGKQVLGPFHKNFTSIVGPNGSGKSNVIDSMLFVFGYRAQKIRSKKISVLIHNSTRHPNVSSCSVHVHFQEIIDKSDDEFDVVPNSQFVVSRTALKDNSSHYTIDGRRVPFKEVGKLLRLHGVDLDHNRFLILQGEVEQIAMMKAKAQSEHDTGMLEFLEDIIGCSRFKDPIAILSKRVEELNEQRTEKVNRVKVVEKEKDELEGAKNEALEYLRSENDIFLKFNTFWQKLKYVAEKEREEKVGSKEKESSDMKDLVEKLQEMKTSRVEQEKDLRSKEEKLEKISKFTDERKADYSDLERKDLQCRENLKHSKEKGNKIVKALGVEQQKVKELSQQPAKSEELTLALEKKKGQLESKLEGEQAKLEKVMASMKKETEGLQVEKDKFESQLLELQKAVNETKSQLNIQQSELELYLSTEQNAKKKLDDFQSNLQKTKETLKEKNRLLAELKEKMPKAQEQYVKVQAELPRVVEAENKLSNDFRQKRMRMEETRSSMQASKSKNRVQQKLLEQRDQGKIPGILGRLGDLGAIDEKYDVAISTACGPLDNIVTDTMDTAQRCVQYLKENNVGVATFIALDKMQKWIPHTKQRMDTPENVPRLFDLVRVRDERVLPAFYFALRDTLVADNLEQATRIGLQGRSRHRVVSLNGELIDISGTMSGGGGQASKGRMGQAIVENAASQQEFEVMSRQIEAMGAQLDNLRKEKNVLEDRQTELQRELRTMADTQRKATSEVKLLVEQEATLSRQVKEQTEQVAATHVDKAKVKQMQTSISKAQKEFDAAAGEAGKVEAEVQSLHKRIMDITGGKMGAAQKAVDNLNKQIDSTTTAMTKTGVEAKTAKRNLKKCESKILSLEAEIAENKKAIEKLSEELKVIEDQAKAIMEDLAKAKVERQAVEEEHKVILTALGDKKKDEQACQSKHIELKNQIKDIDDAIGKLDKKIKVLEHKLSSTKLHDIEGEAVKEFALLSPEDMESVDSELISAEISQMELNLKKMKPNMAAIAEYKKKETQYLLRAAELEAVTALRDTQRGHYDSLRKQRLTDFMDGFSIITTKLKEVYQMLTLGGDAELELVDSLDPFSEGIIFSVRPPKKSWKNISNLSGGEKTLSSLALVFALHFYRPTSLYVMDEIDAALDFRNVSIVGHYIQERTKNAQFIVISLRSNMFELSDRLVGIFKTYDCTQSVTINPKKIGQVADPAP